VLEQIRPSIAVRLGHFMEPALKPLATTGRWASASSGPSPHANSFVSYHGHHPYSFPATPGGINRRPLQRPCGLHLHRPAPRRQTVGTPSLHSCPPRLVVLCHAVHDHDRQHRVRRETGGWGVRFYLVYMNGWRMWYSGGVSNGNIWLRWSGYTRDRRSPERSPPHRR